RRILTVSALTLVVALGCLRGDALAQEPSQQPDTPLDAKIRSEAIEGIIKRLNDGYVFPEVAKKMEQALRERAQKKEYDQITGGQAFAQKLTADLQDVSHDKHLRVSYSRDAIPEETGNREPSPEEQERFLSFLRTTNFGFEKLERLPGNVGYLDLRGFMSPEFGGETAAAAMSLLAN